MGNKISPEDKKNLKLYIFIFIPIITIVGGGLGIIILLMLGAVLDRAFFLTFAIGVVVLHVIIIFTAYGRMKKRYKAKQKGLDLD